jgi:hypothetical protein
MPNHITNIVITDIDLSKYKSEGIDEDTKKPYKLDFDFNKIIPMSDSLHMKNFHSGIETWVKICTGQINFEPAENPTIDIKEFTSRLESSTAIQTIKGKNNRKNVKDFDDKEFEAFIQAIKNYREYGYMSWYEWSIDNWGTKWNAYGVKKIEGFLSFDTAWAHPELIFKKLSSFHPEEKIQVLHNDEGSSEIYLSTYKSGELIEKKEIGNFGYHDDEEKEGYIFEGADFESKDQVFSHLIKTIL